MGGAWDVWGGWDVLGVYPEKLPGPNRKVVFQPPFFQGQALKLPGFTYSKKKITPVN